MIRRAGRLISSAIRNPSGAPVYAQRYASALPYLIKHNSDFRDVEKYCLFVGHGRTGHSLIGSLLNAHPDMIISHELDSLNYMKHSVVPTQNMLFSYILQRDSEFNDEGRDWARYTYNIPNAWQGKVETLRVVGDKKGGGTSSILMENPETLDKLREVLDVPIRFIHVVRNPFDTLASRYKLGYGWDFMNDYYFPRADLVNQVEDRLAQDEFYRTSYEEFVRDTTGTLSDLCDYLGVDPNEQYLSACEEFVFDEPKRTREEVEWPKDKISEIEAKKQEYSWLKEYSFES